MSIQLRLKVMQFLQFYIFGSWLITFGAYAFVKLHFTGTEIGSIYSLMGITSLFMPGIIGILADTRMNKERLFAILHVIGGIAMVIITSTGQYHEIFWLMFISLACYMPTIPLGYTTCYQILEENKLDRIQNFPKIRVWGTIGFVIAVWVLSLTKLELSPLQFLICGIAQIILGFYSFSLPKCKPDNSNSNWKRAFGIDALQLFKNKTMIVFMITAAILGMASQMSNVWVDAFLNIFHDMPQYKDTLLAEYPGIIASIANISEIIFIMVIPFFLTKFGIKKVILMSIIGWSLRFGFLMFGNPGSGMIFIILSMLVYGCAFDFFNISGSLFVDKNSPADIRASAQGLFMTMVNGIGAFVGSLCGGMLVDKFTTTDRTTSWANVWGTCSAITLILAVLFLIFFKYKHNPNNIKSD